MKKEVFIVAESESIDLSRGSEIDQPGPWRIVWRILTLSLFTRCNKEIESNLQKKSTNSTNDKCWKNQIKGLYYFGDKYWR